MSVSHQVSILPRGPYTAIAGKSLVFTCSLSINITDSSGWFLLSTLSTHSCGLISPFKIFEEALIIHTAVKDTILRSGIKDN